VSYKKQELFSLRDNQSSPPVYLVGSVLFIFLVFCVVSLFCTSLLPVLGQIVYGILPLRGSFANLISISFRRTSLIFI
jgi:hypothetical protein